MTSHSRRLTLACLLAVLPAIALAQEVAPDATAPAADLGTRVQSLLAAGIEQPAGAELWQELGADAVTELVAIARDSAEMPHLRQRAARALGHFREARVPGFLAELATQEAYGADLRISALQALADDYPAEAMASAQLAMNGDDAYLRRLCARVLGGMSAAGAGELLEAAAAGETDPIVAAELKSARTRHQEARDRLHTDALTIEVARIDDGTLPELEARWQVSIRAPLQIAGDEQLLRLEARTDAPEILVVEVGATARQELAPAQRWSFEIRTRRTNTDANGSFRLFVAEEGKPSSARRVDVLDK